MDTNYNNYYPGSGNLDSNSNGKPPKKKGGAFKKILIGALVGIIFGLFAGLGFEAMSIGGDLVREKLVANGTISESSSYEDADYEGSKSSDRKDKEDEEALADEDALVDGDADSSEDKDASITDSLGDSDIAKTKLMPESEMKTVYDVSEVAKAVMPSVVSVNNKYVEKMQYFGQTYSQEAEAAGSGIIVGENDSELLIVTNYHVVADAEELTVTFVDDSAVTAQIKGTDPDRDLAVIAVQLSDVKSSTQNKIAIAAIGDSDALVVGEPVIAIGNALGYGQSVTTGVVSALDRTIAASQTQTGTDTSLNTFIQTDAAINPGNSGGALLNIKGEVIGINSNKIGGSTVEGMGYAIPISDALPIIEDLMSKETKLKVSEASQGYLGITGVTVEKEYSEIYGMPVGVYVSSVTEGTGADKAGLVRGDIITAINGESVESMDELKAELQYYSAGTVVELTIMQGSPTGYQDKTVKVKLGGATLN